MFVLAHLSDPHLGPLPRPNFSELAGKRALGFLNWHRRRKGIHRLHITAQLVEDLKAQRPDHIAMTGDLVNLALAAEFAPALQWLATLGPPVDVSFVPGNHDLYVRTTALASQSHWGEYMSGDAGSGFPYLRRRGPLAIVGLSSAIPTAPFMATGALGAAQLRGLRDILAGLQGSDAFRVVLIHHPPVRKPRDRFKRLLDAPALRDILHAHGADLVLHGHDHVHSVVFLQGPAGHIPVVGVPSASAMGGEGDPAAYNLYRIERAGGHWRCEALTRGLRRDRDAISELARRPLVKN